MFWNRKQHKDSVTSKLTLTAFLSILVCFPQPTTAAILRVVTEPISASDPGFGYGGFKEADLFALALGTSTAKLAGGGTVVLAGKPSASSSGDRAQDSLSLESLINSLSQLRLSGSRKQEDGTPPVPILNQVDMANIYEGVYIFTPKSRPKTDSPAKSANTENQSPTRPANSPYGLPSVVYLPQVPGPPPAVSLPQPVGLSLSSVPVSRPPSRSGNLLEPQQRLSTIPTDRLGKLNDFLKTLERFGGLSVNANLSLQPKTAMVKPLNPQANYALSSSLQSGDRGGALAMANQIRQQVAGNSQQLQQQQAQLQQQAQRQIQQQQKEDERLRREQQRQLAEQEKQMRKQYEQQQQQIQKQLQQQLAEQQRIQQQLARQ